MKAPFIAAALGLTALTLSGCEQAQKIARTQVSVLGGNFRATFASDSHVKTWIIKGGKVTSVPEKGYYFFWAMVDGKEKYIQTPIARTYIEEL